ncbi:MULTISPECIES: hypothetical protein [Chelativorans]|nr:MULTISPECIES: hypothetical protein [Chelativorans]
MDVSAGFHPWLVSLLRVAVNELGSRSGRLAGQGGQLHFARFQIIYSRFKRQGSGAGQDGDGLRQFPFFCSASLQALTLRLARD